MNRRGIAALLIVFGTIAIAASSHPADAATRKCHGKTATLVLSAPGTFTIFDDNAVVVGTNGNDVININGSNPLVCSGGGDDRLILFSGGTAYLGSGDDRGLFENGAVGYGEAGSDVGTTIGATFVGGSGNDHISGFNGSNLIGGSGNDEITVDSGSTASGGSGQDVITVNDVVGAIDCGSNSDELTLFAPAESVRRCEVVIDKVP